MTFDEFLLSNETIFKTKYYTVVKVKNNENIDFIYKTSSDFESGVNLECIGFYEKNSNKLYGSPIDFDESLFTNFLECTILELKDKIIKECNILINDYIKNNTSMLKEKGYAIFNKEEYLNEIESQLIKHYIYDEDLPKLNFNVSVNDFYLELKPLLTEYVQRPKEIVEKIFLEYINRKDIYLDSIDGKPQTRLDRIGLAIVEREFKEEQLNEIKKNPDKLWKKKHDIIQGIKDVYGMINVTIKHKDSTLTFKYPRDKLYNFYLDESHIPDLKTRELIKGLYKGEISFGNHFFAEDIVSISYKKQLLYEDMSLLNNKNLIQETYDITDEMFG